jgi:hypothetical protein
MEVFMSYDVLSKPFAQNQIKSRPGPFGKTYRYVPSGEIIKRLNEAGAWDCRIVEKIIDDEEVAVLIELEIDGSKRQQWGGKIRKGVSLSDALKAATSDDIKKTAALFGVALDVYDDDDDYQK